MSPEHTQVRTYGGWRRSRAIGQLGLGPTATFLLLGGLVILLVAAAVSIRALLYLAPPVLTAGVAGVVRVGGIPLAQLVVQRLRWWHGTATGRTGYRAHVVQRHTVMLQLPGTLAATELLSAEDGYGGRYGLVRDRHTGYLTATLLVIAASTWLASTSDADTWVANWGAWLASLGYLPAVRWVSVTVETAPDPGSTLASQVTAAIDPAAPQAARDIISQVVATAPAAAADVDTRVSITIDPAALAAARDLPAAIAEAGQLLVGLETALGACGVTVLGRARAADIAGIVRIAFDPAVRGEVSALLADRISPALEDGLDWPSAGRPERWNTGTATSTTAEPRSPGPGARRPGRTCAVTCSPAWSPPAPTPSGSRCSTGRSRQPTRPACWTARSAPPSSAANTPAAPAATPPPATPTTTPAPGKPPTRKPAARASACSACTSPSRSPTPPSSPPRSPTPKPPPAHPGSGCSGCTAARPPPSPRPCHAASACPRSPADSATSQSRTEPPLLNKFAGADRRTRRARSATSRSHLVSGQSGYAPAQSGTANSVAGPRQAAHRPDGGHRRRQPAPAPQPPQPRQAPSRPTSPRAPLAPAWGWKFADGGRAVHVAPGIEYQATTTQPCGLYPFVAGSGTPAAGTPVGRHQLWGETVCLDPLAWLRAGLVTNPGMFVLGGPGTGKSALVKRLVTGAVATGTRALILGDPKPDYAALVSHLGGQVIRIGRGLDTINPLDAGPLGAARRQMSGPQATQLRLEARSRRLSLLMALATLVREARLSNAEEVLLGRAIDLLDERHSGRREPTVTDVLTVIEQGPDMLRSAARASTARGYAQRAAGLVFTLDLLCNGSLAGVFDGATSRPIDLDSPAVSIDLSAIRAAGDKLLTAAMLCTWSYGFGCVDAAAALADLGAAPPRSYLGVMDELWRALHGARGLVEHADSLTRLNRAKGMASIMITHSLADLDALPTEQDRARARGFMDRSAITVLAGLPPRELARVNQITPLTEPEQALVASWSAPESYQPRARHPGRGKYLIKTGDRLGIPVQLTLVGPEHVLYDTDQAIRAAHTPPRPAPAADRRAAG